MTIEPPSHDALALLNDIAKLSEGLKLGRQGAREGLIRACAMLISEIQHPGEAMLMQLWSQPAHLSVIRMGVAVKLFRAMKDVSDEGATSAEIAAGCEKQLDGKHVDVDLVARMLRHLAAMGTVRETASDMFAPTPLSKSYAQGPKEDFVLYILDNFQPAHQKMPEYFEQRGFKNPDSGVDGPFQYAFNCKGSHYFEYFQKFDPEMGRRFASMMQVWSEGRPRWFQDDYYPVKERLIQGAEDGDVFLVDIGGGTGHDVEGLRQAFQAELPGTLVLQDRPEIIEIAQIGPGVDKMSHDFMIEQPVKGARAYFLHSIIQDWNDEVNTQILKAIVPAMKKGYSKILINDFVLPDEGAHWAQTSLDWELMASLGAYHRPEAHHIKLYEGAGLKMTGFWRHARSLDSVIELELA